MIAFVERFLERYFPQEQTSYEQRVEEAIKPLMQTGLNEDGAKLLRAMAQVHKENAGPLDPAFDEVIKHLSD